MIQTTSASRLSPKVYLVLQYFIRNFFRIENVLAVRLAEGIHGLSLVAYAGSCILAQYDHDVNPAFSYDEAEGTALNIHGITGTAHSRII
eukprot:7109657-Pyramimonas_sp.AAC.1